MMIDAVRMEEQLALMAQSIANLQKIVKDKDIQNSILMSKQELMNVEESNDRYKNASFSNQVENEKKWIKHLEA
ncbi:UNVERIFIED_CONTAM: hypothetical protein Sindi_1818800 [Sesamum indicum]